MAAAMKMGLWRDFWLHTSSPASFPPNSRARLALLGVFWPRDSGAWPLSNQKLGLSPNFTAAAPKISTLSTLPRASPGRASTAIALLPGPSGMLSKRRSSATCESSAVRGLRSTVYGHGAIERCERRRCDRRGSSRLRRARRRGGEGPLVVSDEAGLVYDHRCRGWVCHWQCVGRQ